MAEIKKISTELQLLDKFLDTSGSAGSSGSVLTSTSTGTSWVSAGTPGAGIYLPLTAGSTKPLTGDLYIAKAANQGQLFFGTANANYEIFGGGTWGYMGYNTNGYHRFLIQGAEIMRIHSNSNVGIGTTLPNAKLEVTGDLEDNWAGRFENTNSGGYGILAKIAGTSANERIFEARVGSSAKMLIAGDGNVGIGTTSPGAKLQIGDYPSNNIDITTYPDVPSEHMIHLTAPETTNRYGGGISFGENAFTAANIVVRDAGAAGALDLCFGTGTASGVTEKMRIANNGNVGIGTDDPGQKLTVKGLIGIQRTVNTATSTISMEGNFIFNAYAGYAHVFAQSSSEKMRIDSAGNVGIGKTTSLGVHKLSILKGATNQQLGLYYDENNVAMFGARSSGDAQIYAWNGSSYRNILLGVDASTTNAGNVGIGTSSPDSKLDVTGGDITINTAATGFMNFKYGSAGSEVSRGTITTDGIDLKINSVADLILLPSGTNKVGVGTTNPSYKFHVSGASIVQALTSSAADVSMVFINTTSTNYIEFFNGEYNLYQAGGSASNITLKITNAGAVRFPKYSGTQQTGSPTHILGTDANGLIVKSTAGSSIGPWLPLAAGSGDPLTGDLYINKSVNGVSFARVTNTNTGTSANARFQAVAESSQIDMIATSAGYTGVTGWADAGIVSTDSGASTGLILNAVSGEVQIQTAQTPALTISSGQNATFAGNIFGSSTDFKIGANTSDGSDNAQVKIMGGGDATDTRGASIHLAGNEHGNAGLLQIRAGNGSTGGIRFYEGGSERMRITAGKVGIGTTSPATFLQVSGQGNRAGGNIIMGLSNQGVSKFSQLCGTHYNSVSEPEGISMIGIFSDATQSTVHIGGNIYESNPATAISFWTHTATTHAQGGSQRMIINSAGNVGIGETNPAVPLHISRDSASGENIALLLDNNNTTAGNEIGMLFRSMVGSTNTDFEIFGKANAANDMDLVFQSDGSNERVRFTGDGNVGIGETVPTSKLSIKGAQAAIDITRGTAGDSKWEFSSDSASMYIAEMSTGTRDYIMTLKETTGNIGIGMTSPGEKLSLPDNAKIGLGDSADLQLYHNSTNGVISNGTGHLYIKTTVADKDIIFEASNGAGSVESYFYLDSDQQDVKFDKRIEITGTGSAGGQHTIEFNPGTSAIGYIYHDDTNFNVRAIKAGSDLVLEATHGNVQILNGNGSGTEVGVMIEQYIAHIGDTDTKFGFTAANQFQVIAGGNTNLNVQGNGVDLSYAGSAKLTTQTGGIAITGDLTVTTDVGIGLTNPDVPLHVTANEDGSGIDKGTAKFINTNTGQGATTMHMVQTSSSNFANAVKFWQGSTPTAVGFIRLTTSATQFITSASDLNLKKNITNWSDDTLSKFKALEPKKFRFKTQDVSEDKTLGFIAQNEVDNFPEAYPQFLGEDEKPYYGFNPTGMVPHLMKAIKDLVEKVEILENKITQLENNN